MKQDKKRKWPPNLRKKQGQDGKILSPNWYGRFEFQGETYERSTKTTDAKLARQIVRKWQTDVARGEYLEPKKRQSTPTMADYAEAYLKGPGRKKKSHKSERSIIERSLKPAFGKRRLGDITAADIEAWRDRRLQEPKHHGAGNLSPNMVRHEMALARYLFNRAVRDGLVEKNPVSAVKFPSAGSGRERVVTEDEHQRLLAAVSSKAPHMKPILVLAFETGMRRSEILGLTWDALKERTGFAYLPETKNGTSRWVPLNQAARDALKAWPRRMGTPYLFAHSNGSPICDIKTAWGELCRSAGVKGARFHDLRHSFTTRALERGVDIRTIMRITGHKSVSMFARYSHPSDTHVKAAVESLGEGQPGKDSGIVAKDATMPSVQVAETKGRAGSSAG